MKQLKLFLLTMIGCVLCGACGGDDVVDQPKPKTFEATCTVPAEGCSDYAYTLPDGFTTTNFGFSTDDAPYWLYVYWKGDLRVYYNAQPNNTGAERKYTLVIKDYINKLNLHFVQPALQEESEDPKEMGYNDKTSGNPAYSKKKR